jgi:enamine deaminase RidA (YjgF/YER057c/UK114 family)
VVPTERLQQVEGLTSGVPYAYGAVVPAGARTVFLAGSCPLDDAGAVVGVGSVVEQAGACLENMRLALAAAGADSRDVVFVRALVASSSRSDLAIVWEAVRAAFGGDAPPGTLMGVTALGWPDQLVEIEAVAAIAD